MVKVHQHTIDPVVAWRVRDALAAHPLLGGATAQIQIMASYEGITLDGWVLDEQDRSIGHPAGSTRSRQTVYSGAVANAFSSML